MASTVTTSISFASSQTVTPQSQPANSAISNTFLKQDAAHLAQISQSVSERATKELGDEQKVRRGTQSPKKTEAAFASQHSKDQPEEENQIKDEVEEYVLGRGSQVNVRA